LNLSLLPATKRQDCRDMHCFADAAEPDGAMRKEETEMSNTDVAEYLQTEIGRFSADPPDTDFECGYLAGLIATYDGLGLSPAAIVLDARTLLEPTDV
jgi:hypothetical protein